MREMLIHYYIGQKVQAVFIGDTKAPKLEIKGNYIVISDGEITKFACRCSDFISMSF